MKLSEINLLSEISLSNLNTSNLARQLAQVLEQQGLIVGIDQDAKRDAQRAGVDYLVTFQTNGWGGRGHRWQLYCNRSKVTPSIMARCEDGKVYTYTMGGGTSRFLRALLNDVRSRTLFHRQRQELSNYKSPDTSTGNEDETVAFERPA